VIVSGFKGSRVPAIVIGGPSAGFKDSSDRKSEHREDYIMGRIKPPHNEINSLPFTSYGI